MFFPLLSFKAPSPLPSVSLSLPPLLKFLYGTILFRRSAYVPPILVLIISPPIPSQFCCSNCIQDGALVRGGIWADKTWNMLRECSQCRHQVHLQRLAAGAVADHRLIGVQLCYECIKWVTPKTLLSATYTVCPCRRGNYRLVMLRSFSCTLFGGRIDYLWIIHSLDVWMAASSKF